MANTMFYVLNAVELLILLLRILVGGFTAHIVTWFFRNPRFFAYSTWGYSQVPYRNKQLTKAWIFRDVNELLKKLGEEYEIGVAEVLKILIEELERLYGGKDGLSLIIKKRMEKNACSR